MEFLDPRNDLVQEPHIVSKLSLRPQLVREVFCLQNLSIHRTYPVASLALSYPGRIRSISRILIQAEMTLTLPDQMSPKLSAIYPLLSGTVWIMTENHKEICMGRMIPLNEPFGKIPGMLGVTFSLSPLKKNISPSGHWEGNRGW